MRFPMLLAALAVILAGCAPAPPAAAPVPDLVAARKAAGIADCPESSEAAAIPDGLPDLTLSCLGGDATVRLAGLRGTPMVINYWAQWCAPCRAEARHLAEFARESSGEVMMLGVNYNDPHPALAVEFAELAGWSYPQLADPERLSEGPLGVPGIPLTVLIDAEGRIVGRHPGPFSSTAELSDWVAEGLGES